MTSTIERTKPTRPNGTSRPAGLSTTGTPQRRKQMPWAILGVLMVASAILGFFLWTTQQAERVPVLVAATDIDAGATISAGDLKLVSIGSDPGVVLLEQGQEALVVGQVARGPIPTGTPLSALLVVASDAVPEGSAVVGASLSAGEFPTSALRAGDRVALVAVVANTGVVDGSLDDLGSATIWTIEDLTSSSEPRLFVSLLVDEANSAAIVNAISQNRLRLVLIGAGS